MKPKRFRALQASLAVLLFSGCALFGGGTKDLSSTGQVPAARGTVKFAETDNGNTSVELEVKHLAEPGRLSPPANNYVVWARPGDGGPPRNLGALRVDEDLNGSLQTVTPLRKFELFITGEESGQVERPEGVTLLRTDYER